MTTETRTNHSKPVSSRWQKFQWWSTAIAEAIDYDPQVHAEANTKHLRSEVDRLINRVNELEERQQAESASVKSDAADGR